MTDRVCGCGCDLPMDGMAPAARYATDACRARHWKERTQYDRRAAGNGGNGAQRRTGGPSGRQVSYRKAVRAAEAIIRYVGREHVTGDAELTRRIAEAFMRGALPELQRGEHGDN